MVGRERQLAQLRAGVRRGGRGLVLSALHRAGPRRCGEVPSGRGVPFLGGRARDRPPRQVPSVRRGHHLLPGRRGRQASGRLVGLRPARRRRGEGLFGPRRRRAPGSGLPARRAADGRRPRRAAARRRSGRSGGSSRRCARERPLVLVFDDIHWGEPHVPRASSSTSRIGRAARRSSCCAWRAPTCSTYGPGGAAAS